MASKTADRILETSLKLFNEFGFQNVPVTLIAQHVGISAGNLSYHFKSKRDIVIAVFPSISEEIRSAKQPEGPFYPKSAVDRQVTVSKILWRYRFFFNGLIQLLNSDRILRKQYEQLQDQVVDTLGEVFEELIAQGYFLKPVAPVTARVVAHNIWMVWLSWLRFEQIKSPRNKLPSREALNDSLMMNFAIVQPYLPSAFGKELLEQIELLLVEPELENPHVPKAGKPKRQQTGARSLAAGK